MRFAGRAIDALRLRAALLAARNQEKPVSLQASVLDGIRSIIHAHPAVEAATSRFYMRVLHRPHARRVAQRRGIALSFGSDWIDLSKGPCTVRIARRHGIYVFDLISNFDYYFEAVEPRPHGARALVDYSQARSHRVRGFSLHEVMFPSLAEPLASTDQYLAFAALDEGAVALDLGAYSGLTSILFRERCGQAGRVIAVDADAINLAAIRENLGRYAAVTGREVDLLAGAVWTHDRGISFSCEGNMGSSATDIVGDRLGAADLVPSFTLDGIARRFNLSRVDFIKCDIEGAEAVIFADAAFFARFAPRIIVEVHRVDGRLTTDAVRAALAPHGYTFAMVEQSGGGVGIGETGGLPLMECRPPAS